MLKLSLVLAFVLVSATARAGDYDDGGGVTMYQVAPSGNVVTEMNLGGGMRTYTDSRGFIGRAQDIDRDTTMFFTPSGQTTTVRRVR